MKLNRGMLGSYVKELNLGLLASSGKFYAQAMANVGRAAGSAVREMRGGLSEAEGIAQMNMHVNAAHGFALQGKMKAQQWLGVGHFGGGITARQQAVRFGTMGVGAAGLYGANRMRGRRRY